MVDQVSGIYIITNGKKSGGYVGQTSRQFNRRWDEHKEDLLTGTHVNYRLQQLVDSYSTRAQGVRALRFKILEKCDRSDLDRRELVWITKLGTWNISPNQVQSKAQLLGESKKRQHFFPWWIRLGAAIGAGLLGWHGAGLVGAFVGVALIVILEVS
jgi:predicted GIY-YIG superfamily endonuclease